MTSRNNQRREGRPLVPFAYLASLPRGRRGHIFTKRGSNLPSTSDQIRLRSITVWMSL
jgi:hypothetical protein